MRPDLAIAQAIDRMPTPLRVCLTHPVPFALLAAAFNTAWFHGPLWRYLGAQLPFPSAFAWSAASLVGLLITTLSIVVLLSAALLSNRWLKGFATILFLGNAVALYFMDQYAVLLDRSMMGNVLNTDLGEVVALWHPMLMAYLLFWGALPSALVWVWPLRRVPWWHRAAGWMLLPALGLALTYALSFTWLWIDQHASQIGARLLPWSYVVNSARHWQYERRNRLGFEPLADATAPTLAGPKRVVVLVIGESARADRHSLLGYARDTNAGTRALGAVAIGGVRACASYTLAALDCILSHRGDEAPERHEMGEPLPTYLQRQGVDVIWRTANSGHPPIKVGRFETRAEIRAYCPNAVCENEGWDEGLLHGLKTLIEEAPTPRVFVVLHLSGSHGPAYHSKYPPAFERFKPTCKTVVLSDCDPESLRNAYDNTIAYTDHVLVRLTNILSATGTASAWLYLSDHGESLGESGLYLHGTPRALAPREQLDIPLMLWASPEFRRQAPFDPARASTLSGVGQGHVFHTVMGMLALGGGPYRRERDILGLMQ